MSMSVRERFRELAVLKALGFKRRELSAFILAESFALAMFGALIGIGGAALLFGSGQITKLSGGMFPVFELTPRIAGMAFLIAAVLGLISEHHACHFRRPHERRAGTQDDRLMKLPSNTTSEVWSCAGARRGLDDCVHRAGGRRVRARAGSRSGPGEGQRQYGRPRNLLVVRKGATAESTSQITPEQYRIIRAFEEVAKSNDGSPITSGDLCLVINVPRIDVGEANAIVRGVSPQGKELRPQVELVDGRWFRPGMREVVVSKRLSTRFKNMQIGERFKVGGAAEFTVVGHTTGGRSAFDSEIWMDADESRSVFDRENFSSMLLRPVDEAAKERLVKKLEDDKRFKLRAISETAYYSEQTKAATPIRKPSETS